MSLDRFNADAVSRYLETEARKFSSRPVGTNLLALLQQHDFSRNEIIAIASVPYLQLNDWRNNRGSEFLQRAQVHFCRLLGVISLLRDNDVINPANWLRSPILPGQSQSRLQLFYQKQDVILGLLGLGVIDSEDAFTAVCSFNDSRV